MYTTNSMHVYFVTKSYLPCPYRPGSLETESTYECWCISPSPQPPCLCNSGSGSLCKLFLPKKTKSNFHSSNQTLE